MAMFPRTTVKVKIPTLREERARVGHPRSNSSPRSKIPAGEPGRFGVYGGRYVPETLMAPLAELTEAYEKARTDAFELMLQHATERGANAIIGVRYDANEIAAGVTEVLAYGTAVIVE